MDGGVGDIHPVEDDGAGGWLGQTGNDPHEGCFARKVCSHEDVDSRSKGHGDIRNSVFPSLYESDVV